MLHTHHWRHFHGVVRLSFALVLLVVVAEDKLAATVVELVFKIYAVFFIAEKSLRRIAYAASRLGRGGFDFYFLIIRHQIYRVKVIKFALVNCANVDFFVFKELC